MKNKRIFTFIIALSFLLTGCNINGNEPNITQIENTDNIISASYTETDVPEITTPDNSNGIFSQPSEIDNASDITEITEETSASETSSETDAPISTPSPATEPPATEPPATQAPVVQTQAPVVTTTTTPVPPAEPSPPTIHSTTADGVLTFTNSNAVIDYSNSDDGYVMAKYTGSNSLVKVQVTNPDGDTTQVYTINTKGNYEAIPLTAGNGEYIVRVCEAVGTKFAVVVSGTINVALSSSLAPFLRPSNYVPFAYGDSAVTKSSQLCGGTSNDLEKVDRVYSWLVDNVVYDRAFADSNIPKGYVADTEKVINQKKGICLDYAGTMAAMLRSQNIPTQVAVGQAGTAFHAWVNVYVTDVGWVYGAIYFDGSAWHRMDPTFAASSKSSDKILQYIGDGSNYKTEKLY